MASIPPSPSPASSDPLLIPQGEYAGKQPLRIQRSVVTVGAAEHCHLHLISSSVSRHHALIIKDYDGVYIRDLASRTKVVINGQPHREATLADEDEIHIGKFWFRFAAGSSTARPAAAVPPAQVWVNGKAIEATAGRTLLIGKGDGCDISLSEDSVSSRHAIIFTAKGKRYVRDLDSRTGTFLKGEKIHQNEIGPDDVLRIGETLITLGEVAPGEVAPGEVAPAAATPEAIAPAVQPVARKETPVAEVLPAAEIAEPSEDSIPLELEPEESSEPAPARPEVPPPLRQEPEVETEVPEPVSAASEMDLSIDTVPLEQQPEISLAAPVATDVQDAKTAEEPETVSTESTLDLNIDTIPLDQTPEASASPEVVAPIGSEIPDAKVAEEPETTSTVSELDLNLDAIPLDQTPEAPAASAEPVAPIAPTPRETALAEPEPASAAFKLNWDIEPIPLDVQLQTPDRAAQSQPAEPEPAEPEPAVAEAETPMIAAPAEIAPEPSAKTETPEPEVEPLSLDLDLSDTTLAPAPAEEQKSQAVEERVAAWLEEPEVAPAAVSGPPESPLDLNLDVDLEPVAKVESHEPPQPEQPESVHPNFDLTPPELNADEALRNISPVAADSISLPPTDADEPISLEFSAPSDAVSEMATPIIPSDPSPLETPLLETPQADIAAETPTEKTRKRAARTRKTPATSEPKAAKTTRARVKRVPPKALETPAVDESIAPVAEAESQTIETPALPEPVIPVVQLEPVTDVSELAASPEISSPQADEIPVVISSDSPVEVSEEPVEQSAEPVIDTWETPIAAPEEEFEAVVIDDSTEAATTIPAEPPVPEISPISESPLTIESPAAGEEASTGEEIPVSAEAPTGDWNLPASSTEEIPEPILSADQTEESPVLEAEPELPDTTFEGIDLTEGEWNQRAIPSQEIPAPIEVQDISAQPAAAAPQPAPRNPLPKVIESPLSSLGGLGFIGGGTVNVAHFLGGMPANLPELPPTPAGFGQIRIDMGGSPPPAPTTRPPAPNIPPAQPIFTSEVLQAPPLAEPPPPIAPVAPSVSAAQTPTPTAPASAAPKPTIKPPAPSFIPRPPQKTTFATDVYELEEDKSPPVAQSPAVSSRLPSAFDGLAMGAMPEADVFSDAGATPTPINDAPFGGAPMGQRHDYGIPDSPEQAARAGNPLDKDFAEDDFWNRTDEEDGIDPNAPADAAKNERPQSPIESGSGPADRDEEMPLPAISREELDDLHNEDPADEQTDAGLPPPPKPANAAANAGPAKRRRFRIPFLMPIILLGTLAGVAAIWRLVPVHSQITGTMTFVNFTYTPGTQDSIEFEATQRRLLDDQTRNHAIEILNRDYPGVSEGFLKSAELFGPVAASISLSSSAQGTSPQTLLQLSFTGGDKEGDRVRTLAVLQSLADRDAPMLDTNRRLRDQWQHAQQGVEDAQQKLDAIKKQLVDLQAAIDAAPPAAELARLTKQKAALEQVRLDADQAIERDGAEIAALQAPVAIDASATTQSAAADPQLKQMRQQLADLAAEVDSARSDQLTGARLARQKLETADQAFDEKISAANTLLGSGSQLRQFVDSAMDSQTKARDLINMLIVDGEDLEQQLEDTRRDIEDLIQTQQAEKWAEDPKLQEFRENLQSAQHRYNANTGEGITDARILDPLQKEIDHWTAEVKRRQNLLGADPGEVRVQESINSVIDSLRKKLSKEKHQTDLVLDPLERQLADLDPVVAAMPAAQQDLARQIHERLTALNDAREKYTQTVGDDQIAPSPKVTELKGRIADLRASIAARQADLDRAAVLAAGTRRGGDLAKARAQLQTDQNNLAAAAKSLETGLTAYDELHAKQVAADAAQQKKINLLEDQRSGFAELESARRARDEKQSAANHAFDIKPVTSSDVVVNAPPDPRMMYMLEVMGCGLVAVALATFVSHAGLRRPSKKTSPRTANMDSLVIPLASDDEQTATA